MSVISRTERALGAALMAFSVTAGVGMVGLALLDEAQAARGVRTARLQGQDRACFQFHATGTNFFTSQPTVLEEAVWLPAVFADSSTTIARNFARGTSSEWEPNPHGDDTAVFCYSPPNKADATVRLRGFLSAAPTDAGRVQAVFGVRNGAEPIAGDELPGSWSELNVGANSWKVFDTVEVVTLVDGDCVALGALSRVATTLNARSFAIYAEQLDCWEDSR